MPHIGSRSSSFLAGLLPLLAPLPALVIGILVMQRSGVSPSIWGLQLGAGLVLIIVAAGGSVALQRGRRFRSWTWALVAVAALLVLAASLAHPGVDGIRRWVSFGPLQLHAAFMALPILLVALCAIVRRELVGGAAWFFPAAVIAAAGVLAMQPDASQASAFAVAVVLIAFLQRGVPISHRVAGGIVVAFALLAWSRPDPLDAVPHVEGIVGVAASLGTGWLIGSMLALALLPLSFIAASASRRAHRSDGFALAAYFGMACIAPFAGPYPMPLLGYGLSPYLGYCVALALLHSDSAS